MSLERYPRLEAEDFELPPVYDEQLAPDGGKDVPRETVGILGGVLEVLSPHPEAVAPTKEGATRGLLGYEGEAGMEVWRGLLGDEMDREGRRTEGSIEVTDPDRLVMFRDFLVNMQDAEERDGKEMDRLAKVVNYEEVGSTT